jgi:hypothetical protein
MSAQIFKFPYDASRRVHSQKAAAIKERHTRGKGGKGCSVAPATGGCCPNGGRSRASAVGGRWQEAAR